jgi:hypothetical protein
MQNGGQEKSLQTWGSSKASRLKRGWLGQGVKTWFHKGQKLVSQGSKHGFQGQFGYLVLKMVF